VLYRDLIKAPVTEKLSTPRVTAFTVAAERAKAGSGATQLNAPSTTPTAADSVSARQRHKLDRAMRQSKRQSVKHRLSARRER